MVTLPVGPRLEGPGPRPGPLRFPPSLPTRPRRPRPTTPGSLPLVPTRPTLSVPRRTPVRLGPRRRIVVAETQQRRPLFGEETVSSGAKVLGEKLWGEVVGR